MTKTRGGGASGDRRHSIKISDEILLSVASFPLGVVRQPEPQSSLLPAPKSYRIGPQFTIISPTPSSASLAGTNMRGWSALARAKNVWKL